VKRRLVQFWQTLGVERSRRRSRVLPLPTVAEEDSQQPISIISEDVVNYRVVATARPTSQPSAVIGQPLATNHIFHITMVNYLPRVAVGELSEPDVQIENRPKNPGELSASLTPIMNVHRCREEQDLSNINENASSMPEIISMEETHLNPPPPHIHPKPSSLSLRLNTRASYLPPLIPMAGPSRGYLEPLAVRRPLKKRHFVSKVAWASTRPERTMILTQYPDSGDDLCVETTRVTKLWHENLEDFPPGTFGDVPEPKSS